MKGLVYLIGAGPGDPELLTLKAARALGKADTILHDRLVAPAILELGRRDAEFISVGKQAGKASISQEEINALLVEKGVGKICRTIGFERDLLSVGLGGQRLDRALDPLQLVGEHAEQEALAAAGLGDEHGDGVELDAEAQAAESNTPAMNTSASPKSAWACPGECTKGTNISRR